MTKEQSPSITAAKLRARVIYYYFQHMERHTGKVRLSKDVASRLLCLDEGDGLFSMAVLKAMAQLPEDMVIDEDGDDWVICGDDSSDEGMSLDDIEQEFWGGVSGGFGGDE